MEQNSVPGRNIGIVEDRGKKIKDISVSETRRKIGESRLVGTPYWDPGSIN